MVRAYRKGVGVIVGAAMAVALLVAPLSAAGTCDATLTSEVEGATTSGGLHLISTRTAGGWSYTATSPPAHNIAWLDGTFESSDNHDGISIGGGVLTRSDSLTGEFVSISACLAKLRPGAVERVRVERTDHAAPGLLAL